MSQHSLDLEGGRLAPSLSDSSVALCFAHVSAQTSSGYTILADVSGRVPRGKMLAVMGPSGSGKTSLLDILARRNTTTVDGRIWLDGITPRDGKQIRNHVRYVQQEDALIGALTVRETLLFASKLGSSTSASRLTQATSLDHYQNVDSVIARLGLSDQANTKIGTPIQRGLSGGQKRRVSVGEKLVANVRGDDSDSAVVLVLDEITSGLDAVAAYEVVSRVKEFAAATGMIVVASIHQPSTATFTLFDSLMLLSQGKQVYFGPVNQVPDYFAKQGLVIPNNYNPAEYLLEITNTDFLATKKRSGSARPDISGVSDRDHVAELSRAWQVSEEAILLETALCTTALKEHFDGDLPANGSRLSLLAILRSTYVQTVILVHRALIKAYRDILAYGVRVIMYLCLAILMGTVWLRLTPNQTTIQSYFNAIFFGSAFMSFMTVAYIPAFLEDLATFKKESHENMYGPAAFLLSNVIVGLPFLFLITFLFSVVEYWMTGFRSGGTAFFRFVMWLFLDLVAAESLVVLISSIVPIFVAALAITAFSNGLWMAVGGFLVQPNVLNKFWYYTFYWINYQRYVFDGMIFNEVEERSFSCAWSSDTGCSGCMYAATEVQAGVCEISGKTTLDARGYGGNYTGLWVGLVIAIAIAMRFLTYAWLTFRARRVGK
ncbi:P-loop containing nucleoside triphosphate hydrolase protein [Lipomyces orientalis]|uniref:P-loop containing nucleoside triphosphate hydrolase protein n=1 Tax=Lipomyces orientalis TaxID=1233043 RepID=A0ACC3TKW3_9ASCO